MKSKIFLITLFSVLNIILAIYINTLNKNQLANLEKKSHSEIESIISDKNLTNQIKSYKSLIERVGPVEAQEALFKSGLPFDGQTHLLNHTAGDWIYEKYKEEGLIYCKDYFLSSCYHGFVLHAIAKKGFDVLPKIMENCWKAGAANATQCAHAIGHGLLAQAGYKDLVSALENCDKVSSLSKNFPTYNCYDGVFMENIWAIHEDGLPSKDRWISDTDPIYPCNEAKIPEKYKRACWSNQPMRLYQYYNTDLAKAAGICLKVSNSKYQETCFDGLARQIHPLTHGNIDETFRLCGFLPPARQASCITSVAKAAYSVGDRELPFEICERASNLDNSLCTKELNALVKSFSN